MDRIWKFYQPFDSDYWTPKTVVIVSIWSKESYFEKFRPFYLLRELATQILFTGSEILIILYEFSTPARLLKTTFFDHLETTLS